MEDSEDGAVRQWQRDAARLRVALEQEIRRPASGGAGAVSHWADDAMRRYLFDRYGLRDEGKRHDAPTDDWHLTPGVALARGDASEEAPPGGQGDPHPADAWAGMPEVPPALVRVLDGYSRIRERLRAALALMAAAKREHGEFSAPYRDAYEGYWAAQTAELHDRGLVVIAIDRWGMDRRSAAALAEKTPAPEA